MTCDGKEVQFVFHEKGLESFVCCSSFMNVLAFMNVQSLF